MKDDQIQELFNKYKEGNSTLNEEKVLFKNSKEVKSSLDIWATYIEKNKTETPENLNEKLWNTFQQRKNKKRRLLITTIAAAAAVILVATLLISKPRPKELSYAEKEALLNQAKAMFANDEPKEIEATVIYENEMVIVYRTTE